MALTAIQARTLGAGRHLDGRGLYLVVAASGKGRSWVYRYRDGGRLRDCGLGSCQDVSLKEARKAAEKLRSLRREGVDPLAHKQARKTARKQADAKAITFRQAAEAYMDANRAGWRNPKHAAQWLATLTSYAYPTMGEISVGDVSADHLVDVLSPIWATKNETASRVRGRIEAVLDYAKVRGWRSGENAAAWRGHLAQVFPARARVAKGGHHAAMPFAELPAFMSALSEQGGTAATALTFTILTAARTGEVIGATWGELDLEGAVWTVPAQRMKGGRLHRVPLSTPVIAVLRSVMPAKPDPSAPLFPGARRALPMSNMAMGAVLKRMSIAVTVHGFRSAFRDWAAETTTFAGEVAEAALAHMIKNKAEAAYRRGDLFDKRVSLMTEWANYIVK